MQTVRNGIRLAEQGSWVLVRTKDSQRQYHHPHKRDTVTTAVQAG